MSAKFPIIRAVLPVCLLLAACGGGTGPAGEAPTPTSPSAPTGPSTPTPGGGGGGGGGGGAAPATPSLLNARRDYFELGDIDYAVDDRYAAGRNLSASSPDATGTATLRGMVQYYIAGNQSYKGEAAVAIDFGSDRATGRVGNFVSPIDDSVGGSLSGTGVVATRSGTAYLDMTLTGQTEWAGRTRLDIDAPLRVGTNGQLVLWDEYNSGGVRVRTAIEEGRR